MVSVVVGAGGYLSKTKVCIGHMLFDAKIDFVSFHDVECNEILGFVLE